MEILFISDYVCPYCLVAKEALRQAMNVLGIEAAITWQPIELTPEPRERVDTYHDERRRAGYQVLAEPCKQLGLDMKLPPNVIPRPYTRLAFEGWYYACDHGKGEAFNDLIYRAYFIEELDIGEIPVLAELAQRVGLDAADFTKALENGTYTPKEQAAVARARNLGIRSVPTIFIDGEKLNLQTYTRDEMIGFINDRASMAEGPGFACGADGCG